MSDIHWCSPFFINKVFLIVTENIEMRKRHHLLLCLLLIASIEITFGKNNSHTKPGDIHKKHNNNKNRSNTPRNKRSLYNDDETPFWPTRGKKVLFSNPGPPYIDELDGTEKVSANTKIDNDSPFWGMRGRRESESTENGYPTLPTMPHNSGLNCKHCYTSARKINDFDYDYSKESEFEYDNQNSEEIGENNYPSLGSSLKNRRQENDPFWGARGRRQEDTPFWGQRGRREDVPFWGNRGRRDDSNDPFWSSRGRRDNEVDNEPFWGNRGRRQENEPFWGNRGRRQENDPFWGTRGRRMYFEPFHGKQKQQLKKTLAEAINAVEENIEQLARLRRDDKLSPGSFWSNRRRSSQLKGLFQGGRYKDSINKGLEMDLNAKPSESSTFLNGRMFADQPRYILVERSSRSSGEEDPYFISRGKKKYMNYKLVKAARDRRGAIEEIVKSVRTDPYYIARGKKDADILKAGNSTLLREELDKAKELICAAIDLIMYKKEGITTKREINDNERDRRTILKKLAAQLQIDPYFVSRGKKSDGLVAHDDNLEEFIIEVGEKCNY